MSHKHPVYDTDTHFEIDSKTREITNKSGKTTIVQYDHNSERFSFEIPREVDGHDMTLCDTVEVHYINIDSATKETNSGLYTVDDMQASPEDENVVVLTWLISNNATQYAGSLNFIVKFKCTTDKAVDYVWNSGIFKGITISNGMDNGEAVAKEYPNILLQWEARIAALEKSGTGGNPNGNVDLTGYATEQFVRDGFQPKGDYLESTELTEAVNDALAQAKASGEFDGEDGNDYVLTTDDKNEIAGIAAYPDWSHLKWYVMGDSLTAQNNTFTNKRYYDFVHEKTGIQLIVDGIGGTGYGAGVSDGTNFVERVKNIPVDVDVVTIFGSVNDVRYAGDIYSTAIWDTFNWLALNRPGLRVIVVPPALCKSNDQYNLLKRESLWKTYCDRLQVCALACDFRYVSDMFDCPPFNPNFYGHMEKFFTTDSEGIHPDENGHRALAPYFYNALLQELALKV